MLHWAPVCSLWLRVPVLQRGPRAPRSTRPCYTVFFGPNGLQRAPGGYLSIPHATLGFGVLPLAPATCAPNGATCSLKDCALFCTVRRRRWLSTGLKRLSNYPSG